MNKKSIEYLNTKAWYRLLKVVYVIFFIIVYSGSLVGIYIDGPFTVDDEKTMIVCLLGNKQSFSADDLNVYFSVNDLKNGFNYQNYFEKYYRNEYYIRRILEACSPEPTAYFSDIFKVQRITEINHNKLLSEEEKEENIIDFFKKVNDTTLNSDKLKFLTFDTQIFDVNPSINKFQKTGWALLASIITLISFEFIRRIFYYIIIGKFIPKKKW